MSTIEIYPNVPRPFWVEIGKHCTVNGEGTDIFIITQIHSSMRAVCLKINGKIHGNESFGKLHPVLRCVRGRNNRLTIGKIYTCINEKNNLYQVFDNQCEYTWHLIKCFELY